MNVTIISNTTFYNERKLEIYYKDRSTTIDEYNIEAAIKDLWEAVIWLRKEPPVSEQEKSLLKERYQTLSERHVPLFLPLRYFLPITSQLKPLRIGLEAEYMCFVRSANDLKYDQLLGTILIPDAAGSKVFAKLKLDGLTADKKSALLELELRPYPLESREFSEQLRIIDRLRHVILGTKQGSNIQELLCGFSRELNGYEFRVEQDDSLQFDTCRQEPGPFCQVTVELPLSRLGDPTDKAILDLVKKRAERELLQHARIAADTLIQIIRPLAAKLQGGIYNVNSIKLAKLRGYWAQTIMQTCQTLHYNKNKNLVGFHIRGAGPYCLSARDKLLLNQLFDLKTDSTAKEVFRNTLEEALKKGIVCLAAGKEPKIQESLSFSVYMLMKPSYNFEPRPFQFKSEGLQGDAPHNLEFSYGTTLVELRHVDSALNQGVMRRTEQAFSRIKNAQAMPENRPPKTLSSPLNI